MVTKSEIENEKDAGVSILNVKKNIDNQDILFKSDAANDVNKTTTTTTTTREETVDQKDTVRTSKIPTSGESKKMAAFLLLLLTCWGTATVIVSRYSMIRNGNSSNHYIKSTVVVMMELIRMSTSFLVLCFLNKSPFGAVRSITNQVKTNPFVSLKVAVPSFLYVIQNNLLLFSLSCLDSATYQVIYQLKLLTTTIFAVILLKRKFTIGQWVSIFGLMIGLVIVSLAAANNTATAKTNSTTTTTITDKSVTQGSIDDIKSSYDFYVGVLALLGASITSGFSGIYFEKILKGSGFSFWTLNIQLSFFGLMLASIASLSQDLSQIRKVGFFFGYDGLVWVVVLMQAYGGIIIGLVVKYADNILKAFSSSISILLSAVLSYLLFGTQLTSSFLFGSVFVTLAVFGYSYFSA